MIKVPRYSNFYELEEAILLLKDQYETSLIKLEGKFNTFNVVGELHFVVDILKKLNSTLVLLQVGKEYNKDYRLFLTQFKSLLLDLENAHVLAIKDTSNKSKVLSILRKHYDVILSLGNGFAIKKAIWKQPVQIPLKNGFNLLLNDKTK